MESREGLREEGFEGRDSRRLGTSNALKVFREGLGNREEWGTVVCGFSTP